MLQNSSENWATHFWEIKGTGFIYAEEWDYVIRIISNNYTRYLIARLYLFYLTNYSFFTLNYFNHTTSVVTTNSYLLLSTLSNNHWHT